MTENPQFGRREIRAEDIEEQQCRIGEMVSSISDRLGQDFPADVMGGFLFGVPSKIETTPDGIQQERPWTADDIMERMGEMRVEEEKVVRERMTGGIMMAIKAQTDFFDANEHPLKPRSLDIAEFTITLLKNVLDSDEKISNRYPWEVGEAYRQAELLEVIRRSILKPTQIIIEGQGRGIGSVPGYSDDDFWIERNELITEQMEQASRNRDMDEYDRLERERIREGLDKRSEKEWEDLIGQEERFLSGYVRQSLVRKVNQRREEISFAEVFTNGGERVFPDAFIELERRKLDILQGAVKEVGDNGNFTDVRPWIKSKFGEDATFQTLLDFIDPKEQDNYSPKEIK